MNAFLSLCIEQPAFPATIGILFAIAGLAILAAFEYPDPYRTRSARRNRRNRR